MVAPSALLLKEFCNHCFPVIIFLIYIRMIITGKHIYIYIYIYIYIICGTKRCRTCPYLKQGKEFTFSATNETFRIKHLMNCTSTNLIYAITCAGCGHNYICICIFFNQILLFDRRKLILNAIFNICVSFKY